MRPPLARSRSSRILARRGIHKRGRPRRHRRPALEHLEDRLALAAPHPFDLSALLPENGGDGTHGFVLVGTGEIHGVKFNDLDGDGARDGGEPGLPGWTIYIDQNHNGRLDDEEISTTTKATDDYAFTDLDARPANGTGHWNQSQQGNRI